MSKVNSKSILRIIQDQHDILRESLEILKQDNNSVAQKQSHLSFVIHFLHAHCEAEQSTLFRILTDVETTQYLTFEAQEDHAVVKIMVDELIKLDFMKRWDAVVNQKACALAEVLEHHFNDEEDILFIQAESLFLKEELIQLGDEYQEKFDLFFTIEHQLKDAFNHAHH